MGDRLRVQPNPNQEQLMATPLRPGFSNDDEAVAYFKSPEFAKELGRDFVSSMIRAQNALRSLSKMSHEHVRAAFPDLWPSARRAGEEFAPLSAKQCAEGENLLSFVYQAFQASEKRERKRLHAVALQVDRFRKSDGKSPSVPKRSEILRTTTERSRWWFQSLTTESPNATALAWADGAAGWILDDLLRHRSVLELGDTATKQSAAVHVEQRLPRMKIRARNGELDAHFLESLARECLVGLGRSRAQAKDDVSAIRHEETRRVRGKS
jgi:hypothetical protein